MSKIALGTIESQLDSNKRVQTYLTTEGDNFLVINCTRVRDTL